MGDGFQEGIGGIPGLSVGHFTDLTGATGCTVILAREGAVAGVDVRGSAPATRETDLLAPSATVDLVHGILLTGGSAFGLAAADGVAHFMESEGIGCSFEGSVVPIVPAAALFDLSLGDSRARPCRDSGLAAARAAFDARPGENVEEGNVGAGTGATVGKAFGLQRAMKGGLGTWCHRFPGGERVAALVAVNAFGDIVDPWTGKKVAGCRGGSEEEENGGGLLAHEAFLSGGRGTILESGFSTTLVAIATDVSLTKAQCTLVARMAHDGLARTVVPSHTPVDGDVVFALSTGAGRSSLSPGVLGHGAAHAVAMAVLRGVRLARSLAGMPGLSDDQFA